MKITLRKFHKYISLIVSVQLLLWTVSGIYFSFNKIENVRGEQYRIENKVPSLDQKEQTTKQPTSQSPVPSAKPTTQKPATLRGKDQRNREADVFEPTEKISEDFAAPMPVDI